ncbi:hypothetical protein HPB47_023497 [Ixodes persulcatus]|uniref:Uncharacterized protein n=1 Tax=Ixodes persulcatus TaxID=34615 RepID=A0AC60R165_IXOPE|nr:hypothetical protein HPB47_023497 [Ixodes persulcatus]
MKTCLHEAADVMNDYAKSCGLSCAPQMLELLLLSTQKKHPPGSPTFNIHLEGHTILPSKSVTILRMVFQVDRESTILVNKLKTTTGQVAHMIRRIATKTQSMGKGVAAGAPATQCEARVLRHTCLFLREVACHSSENSMDASNLAVVLAFNCSAHPTPPVPEEIPCRASLARDRCCS